MSESETPEQQVEKTCCWYEISPKNETCGKKGFHRWNNILLCGMHFRMATQIYGYGKI